MVLPRERALIGFRDQFGREPALLVRAPGRVNLLGAHVDHSAGLVLPIAIDRAAWLALSPGDEGQVRVAALDMDDVISFSLDALSPGTAKGWGAYPQGVAWALQEAGFELSGLDAALSSDVPIGAGLSSSAAVEVAFAMAWVALGDLEIEKQRLASLCQRAENVYVGVACGIMDQAASLLGRAGHALLLDCHTLTSEQVPLPDGAVVVVSDTGVRRRLSGSNYNSRRAQVQEGLRLLHAHLPEIASLRDVSVQDLERLEHLLPEPARRRVRHVVTEIARVQAGAESLRAGRLEAFGETLIASHLSSRQDYESSIFELDVLSEAAWAVEGCYGARLSGAGFGGCTLGVVESGAVERFKKEVGAAYVAAVGREPAIYVCKTADGAEIF
jgi:galactokinase